MFTTTPKDKALFIYNPNSGRRIIEQNIDYIKSVFETKFNTIDIIKSKSAEHYKSVIKEACYNYDYVFFSGGDGSFNMAINSIPEDCKKLPVFGYLPGGTTCDMSYNTNISKNPKDGINDLMNSNIKEYAVGRIGEKRFAYVANCGEVNSISHKTTVEDKKKYGNGAYFMYAFKNFRKFIKTNKFVIDGTIYNSLFILITNGKQIGSFLLNEREQGQEVYYMIVVKKGLFNGLFNFLYTALNGVEKAYKKHKIELFYSTEFKIDCDKNEWDTDGEEVHIDFPCTIGYSGLTIKLLINRD